LRNPFASTDFEREQWRTRIDEEIQRINTDTSPNARLVRPPIGSRVAASSIVQHKRYVVVRSFPLRCLGFDAHSRHGVASI
jgi:hypothetical protein